MEQLAGGMAGLLGGFVGRARSAGTQVAGQVEAGLEVWALLFCHLPNLTVLALLALLLEQLH